MVPFSSPSFAWAHSKKETVEPEQERQQHRQGQQVEKRRQRLPGQELADAVDLGYLVHRLAGRVTLEIIKRQPQ